MCMFLYNDSVQIFQLSISHNVLFCPLSSASIYTENHSLNFLLMITLSCNWQGHLTELSFILWICFLWLDQHCIAIKGSPRSKIGRPASTLCLSQPPFCNPIQIFVIKNWHCSVVRVCTCL